MDVATFAGLEVLLEGGDPVTLIEALNPPGWHADAACKERPDLPWVPDRGVNMHVIAEMKAVCRDCLVRDECVEFASGFTPVTLLGIWGGMSGRDRKRLGSAAA